MGTYDTCDLQPGANSWHQLQSMAADVRRRRTNYLQLPSHDGWGLTLPHDPANGGAVAPQEGAGHSESCVRDAAQYGRRRRRDSRLWGERLKTRDYRESEWENAQDERLGDGWVESLDGDLETE